MYSLEEQESQDHIAINLLPLLAKEMQHKGEQPSQAKKPHKWVISLLLPCLICSPFWSPAYVWDRRISPLCLSPFFRLLRLCEEKQHNGDLDEIDGLVGGWMEENLSSSSFFLNSLINFCLCVSRLPSDLNWHGCNWENRQPVKGGEGLYLYSVISHHQLVQRGNCGCKSDRFYWFSPFNELHLPAAAFYRWSTHSVSKKILT